MKINEKIYQILKDFNIDKDEGALCLLGIKHGLELDEVWFERTLKQINLTKIIERDYITREVVWNIALYEDEPVIKNNWDWVDTEYRSLFKEINNKRAGSNKSCLTRMKKYFSENPEYRKEDVLIATALYLAPFRDGTTDPQYLTQADYFIRKSVTRAKEDYASKLEEYMEIYQDSKETYSEQDILRNRGMID